MNILTGLMGRNVKEQWACLTKKVFTINDVLAIDGVVSLEGFTQCM